MTKLCIHIIIDKIKVGIVKHHFLQFFYVLCFTGTRHQVSVYRTIGPLVLVVLDGNLFVLTGNEDIHKSLNEFEIRPDPTTDHRVSCP